MCKYACCMYIPMFSFSPCVMVVKGPGGSRQNKTRCLELEHFMLRYNIKILNEIFLL